MAKNHTRKKRRTCKRRRGGDNEPNKKNLLEPIESGVNLQPNKPKKINYNNNKNLPPGIYTKRKIIVPITQEKVGMSNKARHATTKTPPKTGRPVTPFTPKSVAQPLSTSTHRKNPPIYFTINKNQDPASVRESIVSTSSNENDPTSRRSSTVLLNRVENEPGSQRPSIAPRNVNEIKSRANLWG